MIGSRLAHYEITSHLGTGGMGEVYQATDTRLGRSVAIKFLPEAFTHDAERAGRFEREARVLASLSHPNIATIHGIDEANGRKFLVMELVAGDTIAERLVRGPIPLEDAWPLAKQLADALEAAHDKGIVHRDLKPANIKITPEGQVKVLDFGLAKASEPAQGSGQAPSNLSNSPTMTTPAATAMGVILGTAAYMSPEQAKGRPTDRTTDMWAFGCVLYEMLTGRPVFEGESLGEILGSIFKDEPDWTRLPATTPPSIRRLLRRCLQKDRARRLKDAGDARLEIVEAGSDAAAVTAAPATNRRERFAWMAAVVLLTLIAGALAVTGLRTAPMPAEYRLDIAMPPLTGPGGFAVSPDGKRIVFRGERQQLWIRSFDSTTAVPVAGTTDGNRPFWSADGRSIGFFAEGKLRRVAADGGKARDLANVSLPRGGPGIATTSFSSFRGPTARS
jgi:serine/threonine protein kinase